MRLFSYERVSTDKQGESGLGLEAQRACIEAGALARGAEVVRRYVEVQSSVKRRPELEAALGALGRGEAGGLIVSKLDRLLRSGAGDLEVLVSLARKQGWTLIILDIGLDLSTPMGEAMAAMAAVFAKLERRMIGERTKVALEAARERGVVLGRPVSVDEALAERIRELRADGLTMRAIAEALNADGTPTSRGGGQWWPSTVRVVLQRS